MLVCHCDSRLKTLCARKTVNDGEQRPWRCVCGRVCYNHGTLRIAARAAKRPCVVGKQGHAVEVERILADARIAFALAAQPQYKVALQAGQIICAERKSRFKRNEIVGVHGCIDVVELLALPQAAVKGLG